MNINRFIKSSLLLLTLVLFSSCLKSGLEELPAFEDAEITNVRFDFRYKDVSDEWIDGEATVKVVGLTVKDKVINSETGEISCKLQVPAADGSFTDAIRQTVSLNSVVGKFSISTAASIAPVGDAPVLGVPGDFSSSKEYEVTAADGTTKVWKIQVTALEK